MPSKPKMIISDDHATLSYSAIVSPISVSNAEDEKRISGSEYSWDNERKLNAAEYIPSFAETAEKNPADLNDRVFIKDEYEYVRIFLCEIDFIKSNGNYIEIHAHGKKRLIKKTLKEIEMKLDASFFQVHRSYIVNIKKIERIGGNSLWIRQTEIPIIKQRKEELFLLFNVLS